VLMVGSILLFYNNFAFALSNFFLFSCWAKWRWLCLLVDFGALVRIKIIDEKKLKETENVKWNCSLTWRDMQWCYLAHHRWWKVPHNLGSSLSYHCTRDNKCISLSLTHLRKMLFDWGVLFYVFLLTITGV
jgi:hypothetical protein